MWSQFRGNIQSMLGGGEVQSPFLQTERLGLNSGDVVPPQPEKHRGGCDGGYILIVSI